ncbi:MAG: DNA cytosine methyltransferase [Firmicutes bacterium]|nr:DNA cytosine methyltransferase [Bacillota bacterium]
MQFRILDLFCGAGGFSCGLDKNENFKTVLGLDFDQNAINTFNKNIQGAVGICGDITKESVKEEIIKKAKENKVNMIVGGPPCQGFSLKGKQMGMDDPRNFLFMEYYNIVKEIMPEVVCVMIFL